MPSTAEGSVQKVVVIPRPLETFFFERLTSRYAGCGDVRVVVDRRLGERRRVRWSAGSAPLSERRRHDRRELDVAWSLPDMPFMVS